MKLLENKQKTALKRTVGNYGWGSWVPRYTNN